jgi:hypothetical protein
MTTVAASSLLHNSNNTATPSHGVTETAWEWLQRSNRERASAETPKNDPSSAAWAFIRSGSSGIAPIDAAWSKVSNNNNGGSSSGSNKNGLPVVSLEGMVGKTWMLISLAARFVVATTNSKFPPASATQQQSQSQSSTSPPSLPQVVILDSTYDVTTSKIANVVRSTLLRQPGIEESAIDKDLECCLSRIHVATVDDMAGWVPVLEALRCELKNTTADHPTLVLWDGFLQDVGDESGQMEVIRQLTRLLQDCSVALVTTARHNRTLDSYQRLVSHRIRLERYSGKDCVAIVHGARIPFSLSLGGILS